VYKELIAKNSLNYDAWLNLIFLEESFKNTEKIREVYEAAVGVVPPSQEKRFWRRYIYIWLNYAVFEEEVAEDLARAEQVYERAVKLVPHKKFTFGKLWINFAQFYLRCSDLGKARRVFGRSIGLFPKKKVFKAYISMEEQLCQFDRVRMLY
jgi:crooked neck